MLISLAKSYM